MALSSGQQDVAKGRLLICFLLAPSLTSFEGGKERLELSFQPTLGMKEITFSLQHRAWVLTPTLNSGTAGLCRPKASNQ